MRTGHGGADMTTDWRPVSELPNGPAIRVVIRTPTNAGTTWRYLPYKPDARRQGYPHGRWQMATEYGFRNELLPKDGEWKISA